MTSNTSNQRDLFASHDGDADSVDNERRGSSERVDECRVVYDLTELVERGERFRCLYADPPWRFDNARSRGAAANHYPVMSAEDICKLPVAELSDATGSHLHLWVPVPLLFDAKRVLAAWQFRYKSCLVWCKSGAFGCGNYYRLGHEVLLLGVRGKLRFQDRSLRSWLVAPRTRHSTKPDAIRLMIERASPGPRLELFSRRTVPGWTVYGNEIQRRLF